MLNFLSVSVILYLSFKPSEDHTIFYTLKDRGGGFSGLPHL